MYRYLLHQVKAAVEGNASIFRYQISSDDDTKNMFKLKDGVTFHFFTTQVPCESSQYFSPHTPESRVGPKHCVLKNKFHNSRTITVLKFPSKWDGCGEHISIV